MTAPVTKVLKAYNSSRSDAFRNLYANATNCDIALDLFTVDKLIHQNDHELLIETICIMLEYLADPELQASLPSAYHYQYQAIINRLGINQGAIEINEQYLAPLLSLLPDGPLTSTGYPIRRELADLLRILRQRTDWTSDEFRDAAVSSEWNAAYGSLSEIYAVSTSSDVRIENLHFGLLFTYLFYKPTPHSTPVEDTQNEDVENEDVENEDAENEDAETIAEDEDAEDGDDEAETIIIDPIDENTDEFNFEDSLVEFQKWFGFFGKDTAAKLLLSNNAQQISSFLGCSYYHAISSAFGVIFSVLARAHRVLNYKMVFLFHQLFYTNRGFVVPQIILDYEKDEMENIYEDRAALTYVLSFERKQREDGGFGPNNHDEDIGVSKRCPHLPLLTETKLMYVASMMETGFYNGGTALNACNYLKQHIATIQASFEQIQAKVAEAEAATVNNDEEEDEAGIDEDLQAEHDELEEKLAVSNRFLELSDRFYGALYTEFNCMFNTHTNIAVAYIMAILEEDESSKKIIEQFFGITEDNVLEYNEDIYNEAIKATYASAKDEYQLNFDWAGDEDHMDLVEKARVYHIIQSKPLSDYDLYLYRLLAGLTIIGSVDGLDYVLQRSGQATLQEITPTVIYGRLPLFAFATQLDETNLDMTKALVKRKAKIVVNAQYSESCNIIIATFCNPHFTDSQCVEILDYWVQFCKRNSKNNKIHLNVYELFTIINGSWKLRYTRCQRTESLAFIAEHCLPQQTLVQLLQSKEPAFLSILLGTLTSQSTVSDFSASGNIGPRYGDLTCQQYTQEYLGVIYRTLFPAQQLLAIALQSLPTPVALFVPIFAYQSKPAFDLVFFEHNFPVRLEILATLIPLMVTTADYGSCVDIQTILMQYKTQLHIEKTKKPKKAKKGAKKGKKALEEPISVSFGDEPVVDDAPPTEATVSATSGSRPFDSHFFFPSTLPMLESIHKIELLSSLKVRTMATEVLSTDPEAQYALLEELNANVRRECDKLQLGDETKLCPDFFNQETEELADFSFNLFEKNIASLYNTDFIKDLQNAHPEMSIDDLQKFIKNLYETLINQKLPQQNAKYDILSMNTQVLDAIIWFVEKHEKQLFEDYNLTISHGFTLYCLSALVTLFIRITQNPPPPPQGQEQQEPVPIEKQIVKLVFASFDTLSLPQASPVFQFFQLILNSPFPRIYDKILNKAPQIEQLANFQTPWVSHLYSHFAINVAIADMAIDLEANVINNFRISASSTTITKENNLLTGLPESAKPSASITHNTIEETITISYTPTPLLNTILNAITAEAVASNYMQSFQTHYATRIYSMRNQITRQAQMGQHPSPFVSLSKVNGLTTFIPFLITLNNVDRVSQSVLNIIMDLYTGLDVVSGISAGQIDNVHKIWQFAIKNKLVEPALAGHNQVSLLAYNSTPHYLIDIIDFCANRTAPQEQNPLEAFLFALSSISTADKQIFDKLLLNPLMAPFLRLADIFAPLASKTDLLSINYWSQLEVNFAAVMQQNKKFFDFTDKNNENDEVFFEPEQFALMGVDKQYFLMLFDLIVRSNFSCDNQDDLLKLITQRVNAGSKLSSQLEELQQEICKDDRHTFWTLDKVIQKIPQEYSKPAPEPEIAPSPAAMMNDFMNLNATKATTTKKSGGTLMTALANPMQQMMKQAKTAKTEAKEVQEEAKPAVVVSNTAGTEEKPAIAPSTENALDDQAQSSSVPLIVGAAAAFSLVGALVYAGFTYFKSHQEHQEQNQ